MNLLNFITLDNNLDGFLPDDGTPGDMIIVPFMSFHSNRLIEQALPRHNLPVIIARRQFDTPMFPGDIAMSDSVDHVTVFCVGITGVMNEDTMERLQDTLQSLSPDAEWTACKESEDVPGARAVIEALSDNLDVKRLSWGDIKEKIVSQRGAVS